MTGNATFQEITTKDVSIFKIYAFYLPAALMIVSGLVFAFKVTLTEKKHKKIVEELEAEFTAQQAVSSVQ